MKRSDGSIESSNLPFYSSKFSKLEQNIYRCMVINVYFIDDEQNLTNGSLNQEVLYDCIVIGGKLNGHILTNVKDSRMLGGQYNYSEKVWRASSNKSFLPENGGKKIAEQDGDIVYVGFLDGNTNFPIILGGSLNNQDMSQTGAKKDKGPRLLFQYNGINVLIDKNGQLYVTRKQGEYKSDLEAFVPTEKKPHSKVSFEDKIIKIEDDNDNVVIIDSENQKITITSKKEIDLTSDIIKMIANTKFSIETKTVNITAETVSIDANTTTTSGTTLLAGGGLGVARLGDRAVGSGNHGSPVVSTIIQASNKAFAG